MSNWNSKDIMLGIVLIAIVISGVYGNASVIAKISEGQAEIVINPPDVVVNTPDVVVNIEAPEATEFKPAGSLPIPIPNPYFKTASVNARVIAWDAVNSSSVADYFDEININIFGGVNKTLGLMPFNTSYDATSATGTCPAINTTNSTSIIWNIGDTCWHTYRFQIPDNYDSTGIINITSVLAQALAPTTYAHWDMELIVVASNGEAWNGTSGAYAAVNMTNSSAGLVESTTFSITDVLAAGDIVEVAIAPTATGLPLTEIHLLALKFEYAADSLDK